MSESLIDRKIRKNIVNYLYFRKESLFIQLIFQGIDILFTIGTNIFQRLMDFYTLIQYFVNVNFYKFSINLDLLPKFTYKVQ